MNEIEVYAIDALRLSYYMPIVCLGLVIFFAFPWMEWNSVKPPTEGDKEANPKPVVA